MMGEGLTVILHGRLLVLMVAVLARGHEQARFCCE